MQILLVVALLSIPSMLLVQPITDYMKAKAKHIVEEGQIEMR